MSSFFLFLSFYSMSTCLSIWHLLLNTLSGSFSVSFFVFLQRDLWVPHRIIPSLLDRTFFLSGCGSAATCISLFCDIIKSFYITDSWLIFNPHGCLLARDFATCWWFKLDNQSNYSTYRDIRRPLAMLMRVWGCWSRKTVYCTLDWGSFKTPGKEEEME